MTYKWLFASVIFLATFQTTVSASLIRAEEGAIPRLDFKKQGDWTGPFFFIQMADTQLGMYDANTKWDREIESMRQAASAINRLQPAFVVLCGDMVNAFPNNPISEKQRKDFKQAIGLIHQNIPVICTCGNHDVGNRPTPDTLASYRKAFGDDRFGFWVGGVHFIVLNSSLYFDPSGAPAESLAQSRWLMEELAKGINNRAKHIIVFQHYPWFLEEPKEEDQYFNIPQVRRYPALSLLKTAGVRAVFAGHYHRNAYGTLGNMEMITTAAVGMPLGDDPSGFRIVKVFEDHLEHEYVTLEEAHQVLEARKRGR